MTVATGRLLKEAVHHHRAASHKGALERLFTLWFKGFVYNQIWEDPRVDAQALQLTPESQILTISSGGCNVLNYLLHRPARIVAIDLNSCHMSLLRLKLAAISHLQGYEEFYRFFGTAEQKANVDVYDRYIHPHLDEVSRKFWDGRIWVGRKFGRRRIHYFAAGFYEQAKMGKFLRFVHMLGRVMRRDPRRLLEAKTLAEQERIFDELFNPLFDSRVFRFLSPLPVTVFSLGIPPSQHAVMNEESGGNLIETFRQRVRKLACGFPLEENYFAWQAFARCYDNDHRRAIPDYLREDNYPILKENLGRIETHITSLAGYLKSQPAGALDRFVLLDSQDWMPPNVIADLWSEIARVGKPGSRVIFRTAGERSPIETALPPELRSRFTYEQGLSRQLHDQDRSSIYGMFHVYSFSK